MKEKRCMRNGTSYEEREEYYKGQDMHMKEGKSYEEQDCLEW